MSANKTTLVPEIDDARALIYLRHVPGEAISKSVGDRPEMFRCIDPSPQPITCGGKASGNGKCAIKLFSRATSWPG